VDQTRRRFIDLRKVGGEDLDGLLALLTEWFRKLLLFRVDQNLEKLLTKDLSPDHVETLRKHATSASRQTLAKVSSLLLDKELEMKRTGFPRLCFELAVVEMEEILNKKP